MAGRSALPTLSIAAVLLNLAPVPPAGAQCRLCDTPTTARDEAADGGDIRLEIETSLNFDRLILSGGGAGTVLIRPDGSTSAQGAVTDVGPRAMVGTVIVHGQPGRAVRVELPRRIVLHSLSGGEISFDEVASDLPSVPRLDEAGALTFRFGGRLTVTGDADGDYRGDLPITVEYQ
ncbi:MAG TPA: DUF4402 domain-containing protein [Sphingomicrobium sp.]